MSIAEDFTVRADAIPYPERTKLSKEMWLIARREYDLRHKELDAEFGVALAEKYLPESLAASDEFTSKIFKQAWDSGHSSGYSEVEYDYETLAEFAVMAFEIGAVSK